MDESYLMFMKDLREENKVGFIGGWETGLYFLYLY